MGGGAGPPGPSPRSATGDIIDLTQTDNNELFFVKTRPIGLIILKGTLKYRVNWTVGKLETPLKRARKTTRNDDKREKDNT